MSIRRSFLIQCLCALAVVASLGFSSQVEAANKNNKNKKKGGTAIVKGSASELRTVGRVGKDYLTVGGKHYVVRDDATVIVNGRAAALSQVKRGMQVMVTGRVLEYGRGGDDNIYQATRIVASHDNQLAKKAAEHNKKVRAQVKRNNNKNNNKNRNRR